MYVAGVYVFVCLLGVLRSCVCVCVSVFEVAHQIRVQSNGLTDS